MNVFGFQKIFEYDTFCLNFVVYIHLLIYTNIDVVSVDDILYIH